MTPAAELELRQELARLRTFLWRAMEALEGRRPDLHARFKTLFVRQPAIRAPRRLQ